MCRDRIKVSVGGMKATVGIWNPAEISERGWSLARIQEQKDVEEQRLLATGLRNALRSMGVHRAFAPNVSAFSAEVVHRSTLKNTIDLGGNILLFRDSSVDADGICLKRGQALVASTAGCPFIIAVGGGYMIIAHAGRDSLIDRGWVTGGQPIRTNISVVHAIVKTFAERGVHAYEISMRMELSIPVGVFEHRFDHPEYGEFNKALWKFLIEQWPSGCIRENGSMFLDLEELFKEQARHLGVRDVQSENSLAEFPDLWHTRKDGDSSKRNLFIFKREA